MDPDANLQEQRRLIARLIDHTDGSDVSDCGERLAELARALDDWITNGGFLPAEWRDRSARKPAKFPR